VSLEKQASHEPKKKKEYIWIELLQKCELKRQKGLAKGGGVETHTPKGGEGQASKKTMKSRHEGESF